ncbi:MAG: HD domain-containing protein [Candidatus Buchananbacteria bacterium]
MKNLTLEEVKANPYIDDFIRQTEKYLVALGYTDHGYRHVNIVAERCRGLARQLGLTKKDQELAAIAGYCHDLGNFLGRTQHHYWAAMLFSQIFIPQGVDPDDIARITQAIVSHDKDELKIVDKISAILVLADKSDVHRSRVVSRETRGLEGDIHDRVNYAATGNSLKVNRLLKQVVLKIQIDTQEAKPMDYFEIFSERMSFCRLAAEFLGYKFVLIINNFKLS